MRRMTTILPVVSMLGIAGCTTVDPDDKNELLRRIGALPPPAALTLRQVTAHHYSEIMLNKRDLSKKIGGTVCRRFDPKTGAWGGWVPQVDVTIADVLKCVAQNTEWYGRCADLMVLAATLQSTQAFESAGIPSGDYQCRYAWDQGWAPDEAPSNTDPDRVTPEDIIDAMVSSPVPPPGIPWASPDFAPLVPLLCPLTSWEQDPCAPAPGDRP